jgi:ABC-type Na+ transport system ATPase subunit NatA
MVNSKTNFPGARFYKSDLHIHTPASKCWKGKKDSHEIEEIFNKLREKEIEVIAVTDHNSSQNVEKAKELGAKYGIHVFPGVEVSTKEGHVIAIFDPTRSGKEIEDWLAKMGFVGEKLGDLQSMAEDQDGAALGIDKVFSLIENNGGVAIAPHPNSKGTGFLEVMKQKGLARIAAYVSPCLRGLEVGDDKEGILKLASGRISGYNKKYGCIATSDAHNIEDIGKSFTYIKLGDFGISALKQVFYDPAMRIRFADDWPPECHAWIEGVEVSQGFYDGIRFEFHPDMNCLVGGKAVGKSLLVELIKFALGVTSPIEVVNKSSKDMVNARTCLGEGGTVTVHVVSHDGERYRVQRTVSDLDQGPEVYYADTQAKAALDVRDVFQCKIYSQNEVIELGKTLPALLDWLDGFIDLSQEQTQKEDIRREAKSLLASLDKQHNIAKGIPSLTKKKAELQAKKAHLEKMIREPILTSFPNWQKEERKLRSFQKGLQELKQEVVEPVKKVEIEQYIPKPEKGTPNYEEIAAQRNALIQMGHQFQDLGAKLEQVVAAGEKALTSYLLRWRKRFQMAQKEHEKVIKTAGVKNASALTSELDKVIESIEETEVGLADAQSASKEKRAVENELRQSVIPNFTECFRSIFKKRLDKAKGISDSLQSFVRINVLQMNDRTEYRNAVGALARRSGLRREHIEQIVSRITPVELAELVIDRNVDQLARKTGVTDRNAAVLTDHLWAQNTGKDGTEHVSKLYELMLTELKDSVSVELNVGDAVYKPMNELSVGSKCTAILSVALVEGRTPLIVDQPEDALDNPFVFEQIVKTVRRSKAARQYIFATHNPNIAVSSDADLIYCLKATANEGNIEKQGSIDEISTKDRVVANLEGGKSAFRLRSQKYDIVVEDPNAVVLGIDMR